MTKLPADFVESAVAILDREWVLAGPLTTSEGARAMLQRDLTRQLHAGETATVPLAHIIMMADAGHESAQLALRTWIATHIDESRFNELPLQAQNYALKVMIEPVLPSYGRGHKIIDIWTRDIVIRFLETRAMERWRIKKTQAAYLISVMVKRRGIKLSTRQVLDIFNSHHTLGARVVAFMMAAVPDDEPPGAV